MREIKNCILFSTADWDAPYWTNKQHTAKHLAQRDIRVLYVESVGLRAPKFHSGIDLARIWRRLLRGLKGVRLVEKNIWVISPLVIPFKHQWKLISLINRWIIRSSIIKFCKMQNFQNEKSILWTYNPYVLDYLDIRQYESLVYHCVDDLSAIPGIDSKEFIAKEQDLLREADVIFTTSKKLFEKCVAINVNTYDFPNVVDWEHFSKAFAPGPDPDDLKDIPHPRLGYIGVLSDFKVDFELILNIAKEKPEWHIIFIGEEREGQYNFIVKELKEMKNIHFLGYKKYKSLPSYMRGLDLGLLPSLINTYTESMFPMKYFEYVASGLRVTSTKLKFIEGGIDNSINYFTKNNGVIYPIEEQLSFGKMKPEAAKKIISDNTWDERLSKMIDIINAKKGLR